MHGQNMVGFVEDVGIKLKFSNTILMKLLCNTLDFLEIKVYN
jgi:hypothetical protein